MQIFDKKLTSINSKWLFSKTKRKKLFEFEFSRVYWGKESFLSHYVTTDLRD